MSKFPRGIHAFLGTVPNIVYFTIYAGNHVVRKVQYKPAGGMGAREGFCIHALVTLLCRETKLLYRPPIVVFGLDIGLVAELDFTKKLD